MRIHDFAFLGGFGVCRCARYDWIDVDRDGRRFSTAIAGNHAMQRSRACKVSQMENQRSRPADRRRYPLNAVLL